VVFRRDELRTGGGRPDDAPLVRYQLHGKVAVLTINRPALGAGVARQAEQALGDDVQVDLLRAAVDRLGAAQQVGAL
jgi:hypothetical protein